MTEVSVVKHVILHLDDDVQFLRVARARLRKYGLEVVSISESSQAMETIQAGDFRVVLLDHDMPGLSGLSLLSDIKRHDGGIQVVMLTGASSITSVLGAFRGGAEACFFKPVEDFKPIAESLHAAFGKIEHWRSTLKLLSELRRGMTMEKEPDPAQISELAIAK